MDTKQTKLPLPGTVLMEQFIKPCGLSLNEIARRIDVPAGRISEIVNGKRTISADTALRLGRFFSTGAEYWCRLQNDYDLMLAFNRIGSDLDKIRTFSS